MLWYGIGILYDRYGSYDYAEEAFSQVMQIQPDFDKANEIYFRLGIIYKQQSKFANSLEVSMPEMPCCCCLFRVLTLTTVLQVHRQLPTLAPVPGRHLVPDRPCSRAAEGGKHRTHVQSPHSWSPMADFL